jgi:hypothetical protein
MNLYFRVQCPIQLLKRFTSRLIGGIIIGRYSYLFQDLPSPYIQARDSNQGSPKYKARVLTNRPRSARDWVPRHVRKSPVPPGYRNSGAMQLIGHRNPHSSFSTHYYRYWSVLQDMTQRQQSVHTWAINCLAIKNSWFKFRLNHNFPCVL